MTLDAAAIMARVCQSGVGGALNIQASNLVDPIAVYLWRCKIDHCTATLVMNNTYARIMCSC